jgi:hypothetical protein
LFVHDIDRWCASSTGVSVAFLLDTKAKKCSNNDTGIVSGIDTGDYKYKFSLVKPYPKET